jgi:hypothetical protein
VVDILGECLIANRAVLVTVARQIKQHLPQRILMPTIAAIR